VHTPSHFVPVDVTYVSYAYICPFTSSEPSPGPGSVAEFLFCFHVRIVYACERVSRSRPRPRPCLRLSSKLGSHRIASHGYHFFHFDWTRKYVIRPRNCAVLCCANRGYALPSSVMSRL
jgi:hypothetical protein